MNAKNLVLVTGATGHQGGAVAHELLAAGWPVRAMTRHPESSAAQELQKLGAQVVSGDLDDAASLERSLAGAWGLFSVQNTWEAGVVKEEEQGIRLTELAHKAGIQHLVYTSVASAHRQTGVPHFENKHRIENRIRSIGFPSHVILRPVFFMENFLSPFTLPALQQGRLEQGIAPTTPLQMIAVRDIGQYGRWAFTNHAQLNRREIDMAGDSLTMPQIAAILGLAMGQRIEFARTPIEQVRAFSEDVALMLEWFDRVGYNADIERTAKESGVRPTLLAEWVSTVEWPSASAAA
jgi:uncharacterized protein YbjT (DUF2867 family)